jgi:hypothetical protein
MPVRALQLIWQAETVKAFEAGVKIVFSLNEVE